MKYSDELSFLTELCLQLNSKIMFIDSNIDMLTSLKDLDESNGYYNDLCDEDYDLYDCINSRLSSLCKIKKSLQCRLADALSRIKELSK